LKKSQLLGGTAAFFSLRLDRERKKRKADQEPFIVR